jgi:hypothetical protein
MRKADELENKMGLINLMVKINYQHSELKYLWADETRQPLHQSRQGSILTKNSQPNVWLTH